MRSRALLALLLLSLAVPSAVAAHRSTMPAAHRWVATGQTNSIAGPRRMVVALKGKAPAHRSGDQLVVVSARRARRLFALVEGSRRAGRPVPPPQTCADCGTGYSQADGAYFVPSRAFSRELSRLTTR